MKNIPIIMGVILLFIVLLIGAYITWTMKDELENHPEITEIGAPPRLDIIAAIILPMAIIMFIVLKLSPKEDDKNNL